MVTFPHVNPEVTDADMYETAVLMGRLQARSLHASVREDSASLIPQG